MMSVQRVFFVVAGVCMVVTALQAEEKRPASNPWSRRIDAVLSATKPLPGGRRTRLPLYVWPATDPGPLDDATAERLVRELDQRGIGLICSWWPKNPQRTLAQGLAIARAQTKLGVPVNVNANACLHTFYNGDPSTAHMDAQGKPFWDDSFNAEKQRYKIGCPFTLDSRKDAIRQQVEGFAQAYADAKLKIDFVFADWEIDGPMEYNRAHEYAQRCVRCRSHLQEPGSFLEFQKAMREIRSELQRYVFADPILKRFPKALVGNYAVYPQGGYRQWYDYFEYFVEGQPHVADQRARYRLWAHEFPGSGYTCGMPVVYTWYPTYGWYDFANTDYRWFYNMLLVASDAGRSSGGKVPLVTFVHWHTTAPPPHPDPQVKQLSREAYQELLWHLLLRGTGSLFLWCPAAEDSEECSLVHEVFTAAQEYAEFLNRGTPVAFDVPKQPGTVLSGLRLENQILVRRTDFGSAPKTVELTIGTSKIPIPIAPGKCQVISMP